MDFSNTDIAIQINDKIDKTIIKEIEGILIASNINSYLDVKEDDGLYAGIEWLMPTLIGILLMKGYLNGFTGEMGSDHYKLLKNILVNVGKKIYKEKIINVRWISSKSAPNKITNDYSVVLSLLVKAPNNKNYKFIFPTKISYDEYLESIDEIINFVNNRPEMLSFIEKYKNIVITNQLVCTYDLRKKEIIALDPLRRKK